MRNRLRYKFFIGINPDFTIYYYSAAYFSIFNSQFSILIYHYCGEILFEELFGSFQLCGGIFYYLF